MIASTPSETPISYSLPKERYLFRREDRFLFFDPVSFVWFQTDRLGKAVVDGLADAGDAEKAAEEVSRVAGAPVDAARVYTTKMLRHLVDIGFVHEGEYTPRKWHDGLVDHPLVMYIHLTARCNLKCPYCYNQEHRKTIWKQPVGNRKQFFRLVDEAAELGFREIKLTGGEVLLNPDTLAIARRAKTKGLRVNLLTNGTLMTRELAREIAETVDAVSLSLDSPRPEEHDPVRGSGTHAKVLRAIDWLREAGLEYLHLNSVVTPVNKDSVEDFLTYAWDDLGAQKVTMAASNIVVDDPEGQRGARQYQLEPAEVRDVLERRQAWETEHWGGKPVRPSSLRRTQCGAANGVISVDSDGKLYPCQTMHSPELACGNVFETSLEEVLATSKLLQRVKHLTADYLDECKTCAMRYLCAGGCRQEAYSREKRLDARNRDLCSVFFRRSLEKLWSSANLPATAVADTTGPDRASALDTETRVEMC